MFLNISQAGKEEDEGVKYANKCEDPMLMVRMHKNEVCKILAIELENRLEETGKTSEVLELGYSIDAKAKKRTKYKKSELRLVESLEGLCERVLAYNIHKERSDSTRFAKGMSQTFQTLHGLVNKGVKVELGIPYELWDKPSAEITNMKTQASYSQLFTNSSLLINAFCKAIENWYFNHQGKEPLKKYLCSERALKGDDDSCLIEEIDLEHSVPSTSEEENTPKKKSKKSKNDKNNREEL
ncbi:hypothetical protein B566_EDAN001083 [Ephemera danica]|nr:hypothetical protein B566_EDAN001083 [Ephemera danica]